MNHLTIRARNLERSFFVCVGTDTSWERQELYGGPVTHDRHVQKMNEAAEQVQA